MELMRLNLNNIKMSLLYNIGYKIYKKAQLSLGKTDYSLHSFCRSIDFQGQPKSMISISSDGAYATSYL